MSSEALDQPGAEQRDRRVSQRLRVCDEVITVAIVERGLERPDEATLLEIFGEQKRVAQRNTLATQSVLHREDRRVKYEAALVFDIHDAVLADKLRPQVV